MTSQTKHLIEFSDIMALRCECKQGKCRASLSIPISDVAGREFRSCPSCKEPWVQFLESSYELLLTEFIEKLKRLKDARLGCVLTLEINPEIPPTPQQSMGKS